MPIYEYRCESCGREFEEWQKFSDAPVTLCTVCGGATRRLISQSTFVLKGTGWYVTDYGRGSGTHAPKKTECKASTGESASSSTESKASDCGSSCAKGTSCGDQ